MQLEFKKSTPFIEIKQSKFAIFGKPGSGKSRLASKLDEHVLFIDLDKGLKALSVYNYRDLTSHEVVEWSDLEKSLQWFLDKPFNMVCIDTARLMIDLAEKEICKRNNVKQIKDIPYGGGWSGTRGLIKVTFDKISAKQKGIIFIAHDKVKTYTNAEGVSRTATGLDLPSSYENDLHGFCDFVFFTYKNSKGERYIKTKADSLTESIKDRTECLPTKLLNNDDLAVTQIFEAINKFNGQK